MLIDCNTATFQNHFKTKLSQMLSPDELGSFILVLANSMQDSALQQSLAPELEATFNALKENKGIAAATDDLSVFEALTKTGISQYGAWKTKHIDYWQCAYNPLRALRPDRSSKEVFKGLEQPFNNDSFHFSKPFLKPEILSEENFKNTALQIMYHKFPFAPYHLLIVIEAELNRPQYLDQKTHQLAWNFAIHVEKNITDFGFSYNSLGAGASVNQLHIHGFIDSKLAVEQTLWKHNGGSEYYPLTVSHFISADESWQLIDQLHQQNLPYNLLYRPGACYIIQRQPQNSVKLPGWLSSIGWYEACGGFNLSAENHYKTLTSDNILKALSNYN